MKLSYAITFLLCSVGIYASAQNINLSYNLAGTYGASLTIAKDYQSAGLNPANLGLFDKERNHIFTLGISEINAIVHSEALTKYELTHSLVSGEKLNDDERKQAAIDFSERGTTLELNVMPIGFAIQLPKIGGISFTWQEKITSSVKMNDFMANLIFYGYHSSYFDQIIVNEHGDSVGVINYPDSARTYSQLFQGSKAMLNWYREFNLSYGREIISNDNFSISAGVGLKYLMGFGIADIKFENGGFTGYDAVSPIFGIDYGNINNFSPVNGNGLKPVGQGYGIDLGILVKLKEKLSIGASVTDIGAITWNGNVLEMKNTRLDSLKEYGGAESLNVMNVFNQFTNTDGILKWKGATERKVNLPSRLRAGISYQLLKICEIALEASQPLNEEPGNFDNTLLAAGVGFAPVKGLCLSSGFVSGGATDFDIPFGVSLSLGKHQVYQFGISTGDIISYLRQNKPTLSASVGFLKFSF